MIWHGQKQLLTMFAMQSISRGKLRFNIMLNHCICANLTGIRSLRLTSNTKKIGNGNVMANGPSLQSQKSMWTIRIGDPRNSIHPVIVMPNPIFTSIFHIIGIQVAGNPVWNKEATLETFQVERLCLPKGLGVPTCQQTHACAGIENHRPPVWHQSRDAHPPAD